MLLKIILPPPSAPSSSQLLEPPPSSCSAIAAFTERDRDGMHMGWEVNEGGACYAQNMKRKEIRGIAHHTRKLASDLR